jgi:hypothetical protein
MMHLLDTEKVLNLSLLKKYYDAYAAPLSFGAEQLMRDI